MPPAPPRPAPTEPPPSPRTQRGKPLPLGASRAGEGVNFAVLSRHGTAVSLVVCPPDSTKVLAEIALDPRKNRTGDHWHVRVEGLPPAFSYGWRVDGPKGKRHRFDPTRVLIDPASTMVSGGEVWAGTCEVDPDRTTRRSLVAERPRYDWGDDAPPLTPLEDSVVYEVHVRGFTQSPSSGVMHPGTFKGLAEKLPYLKWLGVTAIELLPVHEFDECDCPFWNPDTGEKLVNFWGYNSIAFGAPKGAYAATAPEFGQVEEFRDLVKAAHAHGIEVWLDVVFNHTGEGDDRGRTYSLRGLDNELAYLMDAEGKYLNFSGCGNTLNCNHPAVRELILACLRYWVGDMHVDGFRFDLASILGRDRNGNVLVEPPVIEQIAEDGVMADTKLVAEPWDAAGLYQVGGFPFGRRWSEWNGQYRDDVRKFWRGDGDQTSRVASRICGSGDIYGPTGRSPRHSVNFVTCHDGFTLWDLVSYAHKHNAANGEDGRDGTTENYSSNGGVEGPTPDAAVHALRLRRAKSMLATLMISQGVPMLLSGDEVLRTQGGNNNAWCQDNDINWLDWTLQQSNAPFLRFARELIWLRRKHPVFRRRQFFFGKLGPVYAPPPAPGDGAAGEDVGRHRAGRQSSRTAPLADIHWHGQAPFEPNFAPQSRHLAFSLDGRFTGRDGEPGYEPDADFYFALNAESAETAFVVPPSPTGRGWKRLLDTASESPLDIQPEGGVAVVAGETLRAAPFALVGLVAG